VLVGGEGQSPSRGSGDEAESFCKIRHANLHAQTYLQMQNL